MAWKCGHFRLIDGLVLLVAGQHGFEYFNQFRKMFFVITPEIY
jgi:hypothetical protein